MKLSDDLYPGGNFENSGPLPTIVYVMACTGELYPKENYKKEYPWKIKGEKIQIYRVWY